MRRGEPWWSFPFSFLLPFSCGKQERGNGFVRLLPPDVLRGDVYFPPS